MTGAELEVIAGLTAFFGGGTFFLIGLKMYLSHRARRLGAGGGEQLHRLAETVDELRHDLADSRLELTDVQERLDFAERLLTKARDEGRLNA
jgi:hypothetical protein